MPFRRYASAFDLDEIPTLCDALDIAWAHLNADGTTLQNNDETTARLASLIVERAETGERDPDRLAAGALEKFRH
jgi:hypothetical protein